MSAVPFGWCLDGHHAHCRVSAVGISGERVSCSCDCHKGPQCVESARLDGSVGSSVRNPDRRHRIAPLSPAQTLDEV